MNGPAFECALDAHFDRKAAQYYEEMCDEDGPDEDAPDEADED